MAGKDDSLQAINVRLDGKNYSYWSYVLKNFLKGKKMWGYVSGTIVKPKEATDLDSWEVDNSKIITWINNSVEHSIGVQLAKYETGKEVWDHLERLYTQSNFAKQYQLEADIRALEQRDMSIQEFYSTMTDLWDQLALTEPAELRAFGPYIARREEQRLVQFLMALRSDFEGLRSNILHRTPLPSVDSVVSELLADETRLKTQAGKGILPTPSPSVLVVPHKPFTSNQNKSRPRVGFDECSFCKKKGHWKSQCPELMGRNQSQQSGILRQSHRFPPQFSTAAAVSPSGSTTNPTLASITEQLQKLLDVQSHAMFVSSPIGQSISNESGMHSTTWILDSGASFHMSPNSKLFASLNPMPSVPVMTADGTPMPLAGIGSIVSSNFSLPNVYHIPKLSLNLVSVGQLFDSGYKVSFSPDSCCVQDPRTQKLIGTGRRRGGLYVLDELRLPVAVAHSADLSSFRLSSKSSSFYLWHSRLGHVSAYRLKYLVSSGNLGNLQVHDISNCSGCKLAKFSALPFKLSKSLSVAPFDLIHSDVWGPSPAPTKGGSRYYVSFIDDYTRFCWIFLMKHRSEFFDIYCRFRAYVKTQHNSVIKCFRCDLGGEYTSNKLCELLALDGTIYQTSCTDTPEQNGVAERKHRHILETARSLLLSSSVPNQFWGEAVLTAVNLINNIPSSITSGLSTFEKLYGCCLDYSSLRVFGCTCFVLRPHVERDKLSSRSAVCVFLGYGDEQKGYRCFDPTSQKLYVSRHVVFLEHIPFYSIPINAHNLKKLDVFNLESFSEQEDSTQTPDSSPTEENATGTPIPDTIAPPPTTVTQDAPETVDPPRQSQRPRKSTRLPEFVYSTYSPSFTSFLASIHSLSEPSSYKEAATDPLWQHAMSEELSALQKTHTWDLVPLPNGKRAIGSRWVYKIKTKSDGSVELYKARLVAKGFTQEYGLDFEETFAPVAKMTTIRTLIAVAAVRKWNISQIDVKNAFLNGDLNEEVYMVPPPGVPHKTGEVCKLKKALYGLKQAPRAWFENFSDVILSLGFSASEHDSALFVKHTSAGRILLSLYVDDMIITGDDLQGINALKSELAAQFEMKDLGPLRYFLGIEVASSPRGYLLSQSKYTAEIIERARLTDTRVVDSPSELNVEYSPTDGSLLTDPTLYRTIVGSLVYLTITQPDIAYAVHIVSQFVAAPTSTHWTAVVRILRYLRGTMFRSLLLSSTSSLELRAYSDAAYARNPTDRRSVTCFCVFLGDSLISWKSKKQSVVSLSSTEAEYRAMASTSKEIIWLRWLLADMGVFLPHPTPMYCDNRSAIQITHNSVFHERTKHIEVDCHFTRHHLKRGTLSLSFVSSTLQLADFFTKSHPISRFRFLVSKLSMLLAPAS
ncbi:hypothetical protein L6452_00500 [Arctium lappa]|uniref:Uncharacterized protein n=1 Tax=Arctium lappa TaxID=4217 RepID=A0ACB9FF22_ARCLA|nr:hypothetical protein L6452_00500 [Arctium lappa]